MKACCRSQSNTWLNTLWAQLSHRTSYSANGYPTPNHQDMLRCVQERTNPNLVHPSSMLRTCLIRPCFRLTFYVAEGTLFVCPSPEAATNAPNRRNIRRLQLPTAGRAWAPTGLRVSERDRTSKIQRHSICMYSWTARRVVLALLRNWKVIARATSAPCTPLLTFCNHHETSCPSPNTQLRVPTS